MDLQEEKNDKICISKIKLKYKIKQDEEEFINIFGLDFVKENKDKCTMVIEGKEHELETRFNKKNFKKQYLEIELKINKPLKDISCFFCYCSSLINISDAFSDLDVSCMTNFNFIFCGCSSLSQLPDISKWNMKSAQKINFIFSNCSSLKSLPDISKWNTSKISLMESDF